MRFPTERVEAGRLRRVRRGRARTPLQGSLLRDREPRGRRGHLAGGVPQAVGAVGSDRADRRSDRLPVPGRVQRVPVAAASGGDGAPTTGTGPGRTRRVRRGGDARRRARPPARPLAPSAGRPLLVHLLGYLSEQAARIRAFGVHRSEPGEPGPRPFERRKERGMPDVQEVFRMATQKIRPDPGFVDRQFDHQRRTARTGGWEPSRSWRPSSSA